MSGLEPTAIDANGIQVITADNNGSISIGPTGITLKEGLITPPLITGSIGYAGFSTTNPLGIQFLSTINLNNNNITNVGTLTAANIVGPVNKKFFYDEQWGESNAENGLLMFRLGGSGASLSTQAAAEVDHYGIVRVSTATSNTNATWTMRSPLLWSNIDYFEVVFRGWPIDTSNNTSLSVGLLNSTTSLTSTSVILQYSTSVAPTNVWNIKANDVSVGSFTGTLATQNVDVWLKLRIVNTNNTGSFNATLTRLDTNVSETISGSGIVVATQKFLGGGVSCVSGGVSKRMDFDSFELQVK